MASFASVNPATEEVQAVFEGHDDAEVDRRLEAAWRAWRALKGLRPEQRGALLSAAADLLEAEASDVAAMVTAEMGKPFAQARAEAVKSARALRWFAEHGPGLLAEREVPAGARRSVVRREPLGPVLAVMPWNFPVWQVMRFAAPGLVAGNVVVLKHASNVPRTACYLEGLFQRAGFPEGAFVTLLIESSRIQRVIADPRIRAVTVTGSTAAGSAVAEAAGRHVKKSVLELGGSDPFVVLPSADLDEAVAVAVEARVQNNGQSCIAAKRFIVHEACYDAFEARLVERMEHLVVGDPMDPATELGPLATKRGLEELAAQVDDALAGGAKALCGGVPRGGPGFWYPPTVLVGVGPEMRAGREELFGPVAVLARARSLEHAIELANASAFGLGASVWTRDEAEQQTLVDELDVGMVFVNAMVASTPELPFGGVKASGYGRELGAEGLLELTATKTVWYA
jgi:succinate-semialdehyde dehydrogenase/glutarate-semialdehyde dehydrogenase